MPSILFAILAIGSAVPTATAPTRPGEDVQETWTDEQGTWTALPDPDPERIVQPVPNLTRLPSRPSRRPSASFDRDLHDAESRADEALRRAEEAVARAGETIRAAGEDR